MIDLFSLRALVIGLTFFLAGIVKGVTGMGLPTVAMGVLGAIMPPVTAASLLVIPSFVTNFWQLFTGPSFTALMARLWLMMVGIVIGTLAGSRLLTSAKRCFATCQRVRLNAWSRPTTRLSHTTSVSAICLRYRNRLRKLGQTQQAVRKDRVVTNASGMS